MDIFTAHDATMAGKGVMLRAYRFHTIIINQRAKLAMQLAAKQKWEIEFLNAFISPANRDTVQLSDAYDYELADIAATRQLQSEAETLMKRFTAKIMESIKSGEVPAVKFTSKICEGIPEEVILEYIREEKPQMVAMGTRETNKKRRNSSEA